MGILGILHQKVKRCPDYDTAPSPRVDVVLWALTIQYNQIGNITFQAVMATAWPWPYPEAYSQLPNCLPKITVPMNRADPFFERDATGWQFVDVNSGKAAMHYQLPDNKNRTVAFDTATGKPRDMEYQDYGKRIPPQTHF